MKERRIWDTRRSKPRWRPAWNAFWLQQRPQPAKGRVRVTRGRRIDWKGPSHSYHIRNFKFKVTHRNEQGEIRFYAEDPTPTGGAPARSKKSPKSQFKFETFSHRAKYMTEPQFLCEYQVWTLNWCRNKLFMKRLSIYELPGFLPRPP